MANRNAPGGAVVDARVLQLATVRQVDQDPEGRARVLVDVPQPGAGGEGIWARLASGYATANAGMVFIPEPGDEVVLGFLDGDPGSPVILGSLYGAGHMPPYTADASNATKAIVTRGQLKISMNDVKGTLRIETPGGHVVTLDDGARTVTIVDASRNTLQMSCAGITLDSPGDIGIKAAGRISIAAGASVTVDAMDVGIDAGMALVGRGGATTELTAGAELTIQASVVNIN